MRLKRFRRLETNPQGVRLFGSLCTKRNMVIVVPDFDSQFCTKMHQIRIVPMRLIAIKA